jgi:hypothetical protein
MGGSRATGKLATLCNPPYSLTNEIAESVSDEGSADRSRYDAYGGVLLACRGKFPIHQLQKGSQFAILFLKILDPEPFRFVQFCFMHIEETGVRAEVSAIQTRIRMRTCGRARATTDVPPLASPSRDRERASMQNW